MMINDQNAQLGGGSVPRSAPTQQDESTLDKARDTAQHLASDAKRQAATQLRSRAESGKGRVADAVGAVAQSLRASRDHLHQQDQAPLGDFADRAANKADDLAGFLRDTDVREMARRAEAFARREPALFLGGLFAVGLLGARFLKSAPPEDDARFGDTRSGDALRGRHGLGLRDSSSGGHATGGHRGALYPERDVTGTSRASGLAPHPSADTARDGVPDTGSAVHGEATSAASDPARRGPIGR